MPEAKTTTVFSNLTSSNKWIGEVLAPNVKIYGIPPFISQVLETDSLVFIEI